METVGDACVYVHIKRIKNFFVSQLGLVLDVWYSVLYLNVELPILNHLLNLSDQCSKHCHFMWPYHIILQSLNCTHLKILQKYTI